MKTVRSERKKGKEANVKEENRLNRDLHDYADCRECTMQQGQVSCQPNYLLENPREIGHPQGMPLQHNHPGNPVIRNIPVQIILKV